MRYLRIGVRELVTLSMLCAVANAQTTAFSQAPRGDLPTGAPPARTITTSGRYAVASVGDVLVMVDTATGRSWWLNRVGGTAEWLPIKGPSDLIAPPQRADAGPAAPSTATDVRQLAQDILNRYDRNRDGKLDQQEIQNTTRLRENWQKYDANKDNLIDLDELVAFVKGLSSDVGAGRSPADSRPAAPPQSAREQAKQLIARFDRNGDGKLSSDEFPRFFGPDKFKELDTNNDGFIDLDEFIKGSERLFGTRR